MNKDKYFAIGVMSGTSFDGIDISLIHSDGKKYFKPIKSSFYKYSQKIRNKLFQISKNFNKNQYGTGNLIDIQSQISKAYIKSLKLFICRNRVKKLELICLHGQTIYHDSAKKISIQLCDGNLISKELKIKVIYDFRQNDLKHGGEGAPLVPIFHKMLSGYLKLGGNKMFVNIGGISNITFISSKGLLVSYDAGPGMSLLDEYVFVKKKENYDRNGSYSLKGRTSYKVLNKVLNDKYFKKNPPKSIDKFYFSLKPFMKLKFVDACSTITTFTAKAILNEVKKFKTDRILIMGGGVKNKYLINILKKDLKLKLSSVNELNFDNDFVESQAFAYLGIRRIKNLPISFPSTTGVSFPATGGRIINYR